MMISNYVRLLSKGCAAVFLCLGLSQCVSTQSARMPNMDTQRASTLQRDIEISQEATGDFYYGRRYFVQKTRFWGYLRKPRQPWSQAALVVMNESATLQPDRLAEDGPEGARHGYDQNYTYRVFGAYTGRKIYDPASNLFLPEFKATRYQLVNYDSGWLFSPNDHYDPTRITLINRSILQPQPTR